MGILARARRARQYRSLWKRVERTPTRHVAELTTGEVQLEGTAVAAELVPVPFTDGHAIGYRVRIWQDTGPLRHLILAKQEICNFFLDDGTGRALIHAERTQLLLQPEFSQRIGIDSGHRRFPRDLLELLELHLDWKPAPEETLSWTVWALHPGARVLVSGSGLTEASSTGEPRNLREPPLRLIVRHPAGGEVVIADRQRGALIEALRQRSIDL